MSYGFNSVIQNFAPSTVGTPESSPFVPARVLDVIMSNKHSDFKEQGGWDSIGVIKFKPIYSPSLESNKRAFLYARPFFSNIKHYPLKNEVVFVMFLPNQNTQNDTSDGTYYYIDTVNIWSSIHHNALPDKIDFSKLPKNQNQDYVLTSAGSVQKLPDPPSTSPTPAPYSTTPSPTPSSPTFDNFPIIVEGTYIANDCDELHAFEGTGGKVVGGMNGILKDKLIDLYNKKINPKVTKVEANVSGFTVSWKVTIEKSLDGKAWVGFTSRGAGCGNDVINRSISEVDGNGPNSIREKITTTFNETNFDLEVVNDIIYNDPNGNNSFRQVFYRYTKPQGFPPLPSTPTSTTPQQTSTTPQSVSTTPISNDPYSGPTGPNNALFIGDSIAHGAAGRSGNGGNVESDSKVGRSSKKVYEHITKQSPSYYTNQRVYLSTGIANSTSDVDSADKSIKYLVDAGADVRLLGVGNQWNASHGDINGVIEKLAKKYNIPFYGGFDASGDVPLYIHGSYSTYKKYLEEGDKNAPPFQSKVNPSASTTSPTNPNTASPPPPTELTGVSRRVTDNSTEIELGTTFKEKLDIHPLLPYEGDTIIEGRWGQSLRFGSTTIKSNTKNLWSINGIDGDPITIIRNGQPIQTPKEGWVPILEDINSDGSSIYIGSTQTIPIKLSSTNISSFNTTFELSFPNNIILRDTPPVTASISAQAKDSKLETNVSPTKTEKPKVFPKSATPLYTDVLVCSHITKIDISGKTFPENQLGSIKLLIEENIDLIEMDIQITKDGVPVLFHDATLDAKTNGTGTIQSKNWEDVSKIKYKAHSSEGISRLDDAIKYLKSSGKNVIFQLDKCDQNEISIIGKLGLFKGVENLMLAKGQSFSPPQSVIDNNLIWMPILPQKYVGKMDNDATIDEIVSLCRGKKYLEAQFSDSDTKLIDGTLATKLKAIGCRLLVVAVGGTTYTNGESFRGDSESKWDKMINPMGAGSIMTNYPIKLRNYIKSLKK